MTDEDAKAKEEAEQDRERYRESLCEGRDDAQGSFDKAIMTLSGGALTIALGFVRTTEPPLWRSALIASWFLLAVSLVCELFSFRTSYSSYNAALNQTDDQLDQNRIYCEVPGGKHATMTERLNNGALWGFILGLVFLGMFMARNLDRLGSNDRDHRQASHAAAYPATGPGGAGQNATAAPAPAGQKVVGPGNMAADKQSPSAATPSPSPTSERVMEGKLPPPLPPKPTATPPKR